MGENRTAVRDHVIRRRLGYACLVVGVAQATLAAARPPGQAPAAQAPAAACARYTNGGISDAFFWPTFEQVIDSADVIVEATVSAVSSSFDPATGSLRDAVFEERDVTLAPIRALKGPVPRGPFVVSQGAEINAFRMNPGDRFILVMDAPPGGDRYRVFKFAAICVDGDRVRIARDIYGTRFDGRLAADVVGEIVSYLNLPRLRGRVSFDESPFPSPETLVLPWTDESHRGRLRVLLTQVGTVSSNRHRQTAAVLTAEPSDIVDPRVATAIGLDPPAAGERAPRLFAIDGTGSFELPIEPGTYELAVEALPFGYSVASITLGGRAVDGRTITVERGGPTELSVSLRRAASGARVSGIISRLPADPSGTFSVVMIPEAIRQSAAGVTQVGADGTYVFTSVPPGRYTLQTRAPQRTAGTTWGVPSSTTVTVETAPLSVDLPLFTGAEGRARMVDAAGNLDRGQTAVLTFDNDRGTRVNVAVSQGIARFWLPAGTYYVRATQTGGYTRLASGDSLFLTPIRSDGVKPLTLDLVVDRESQP